MPPINHLAYILEDTKTAIESLESASNLVPRQWYFATDENRAYYAATSSVLVGPIAAASGVSFSNTDTVEHTDNGGNDFEFDVRIDSASNNVLTSTANGLMVPDISIETTSQQYLEYNPATRELSVKQLLFSSVTVDQTHATLAAFIDAEYTQGDEFQEGDSVVLTQAEQKEIWMHNGGTAGTAADWTKINANHLDDEYIRGLLSGGDGISYNSTTGQISIALSSASNNALGFSGGELFLSNLYGFVTNGQGGSVGIRFGNTLRIQAPDLMEVTQPIASGNIRAFDFSWDTSGASAGQVATFDGTNVVWEDAAGADPLEHWEEEYIDLSGQAKDIVAWKVKGATSNVDAAVVPKSDGAFLLAVPNGTASGGNARGVRAVDLQLARVQAAQVASGASSAVIGGLGNKATGTYSITLGGYWNEAAGQSSIAAGNRSRAMHDGSLVLSCQHTTTNDLESTQNNEAVLGYKNRIYLFTDLAQISGELRIDTVDEDNSLTRVLVADTQGNIRRRDVSTIGGGANIYSEDGALSGNRNVGLAGNTLTFRDSSDNNIVRFSESGSTIRAMSGDIEVDTAGSGLIIKSPNGTRHRITVANAGFLQTTAL